MKVNIGKYPTRLICNLHTNYMKEKYDGITLENADHMDHVIEAFEDMIQSFYNIFNWLWFDRRVQKVSIRIDEHDTWSMDATLAQIILPMLKQLQATKHGSPLVDNIDVPEELHSTNVKNEWGSDDNVHNRWDWVMTEIIWTFEHKCRDSWQSDFYYNKWDMEGQKAHQARMNNGFRLFGKYYEGLWD